VVIQRKQNILALSKRLRLLGQLKVDLIHRLPTRLFGEQWQAARCARPLTALHIRGMVCRALRTLVSYSLSALSARHDAYTRTRHRVSEDARTQARHSGVRSANTDSRTGLYMRDDGRYAAGPDASPVYDRDVRVRRRTPARLLFAELVRRHAAAPCRDGKPGPAVLVWCPRARRCSNTPRPRAHAGPARIPVSLCDVLFAARAEAVRGSLRCF
jgi:hypothetical protein